MSFGEVTRQVAELWKAAGKADKSVYEKKANADKIRFVLYP